MLIPNTITAEDDWTMKVSKIAPRKETHIEPPDNPRNSSTSLWSARDEADALARLRPTNIRAIPNKAVAIGRNLMVLLLNMNTLAAPNT